MHWIFDRPELRVAIALVIGLVIGAEREQRMSEGSDPKVHRSAGLRTFAIVGLLGAAGVLLETPWAVPALALGVVALATVAYVVGDRTDPGITSEVALVLTFVLGALAMRAPELALGIGIVTALLLAFRARLHEAVQVTLTPAELRDALLVAAAALVALPLLPDRTVDPWHVLNPFVLWRIVVLLLAVHLVAHVAKRAFGARWGLVVAGLASGFVSSSATIAAMGQRYAKDPAHGRAAIAGATASSVATFAQMALLVTSASPRLGAALAVPLAAGGALALAIAIAVAWGASREAPADQRSERAVNVRGALAFAAIVGVVSILGALARDLAGDRGVLVAAMLAALADAHAAAASVATVEGSGALTSDVAVLGVLGCLSTNSITKCVLAFSQGGRTYGAIVTGATVAVLAAAWVAWAVGS